MQLRPLCRIITVIQLTYNVPPPQIVIPREGNGANDSIFVMQYAEKCPLFLFTNAVFISQLCPFVSNVSRAFMPLKQYYMHKN